MSSKCVTDKRGNKRWYKLGTEKLHREDRPAIELANRSKEWYLNRKYLTETGWKEQVSSNSDNILIFQ